MLRIEIRPFFRRARTAAKAAAECIALNPLVQTDWDSGKAVVSVPLPRRRAGNFLRTVRRNYGQYSWYLVDLPAGESVLSGVIQADPAPVELAERLR